MIAQKVTLFVRQEFDKPFCLPQDERAFNGFPFLASYFMLSSILYVLLLQFPFRSPNMGQGWIGKSHPGDHTIIKRHGVLREFRQVPPILSRSIWATRAPLAAAV